MHGIVELKYVSSIRSPLGTDYLANKMAKYTSSTTRSIQCLSGRRSRDYVGRSSGGRSFGAGLAGRPDLIAQREPVSASRHSIRDPVARYRAAWRSLSLLLFCLDVSVRSRGRLIPYGDRRAEARQPCGLADHSAFAPRRGHLRLLRCDKNIMQ
jgi:hypothetical protein